MEGWGEGMEEKIPLLAIVGPTASGKTKLSIELCKAFGGEVVSADSMQIYRHMTIGTAKPTPAEREGIPHHLMDFLDPGETFSVAQYVALAHACIREIHSRGRLPVLVGGTGLYVSSLVDNLRFSEIESDPALRRSLEALAAERGNEYLLEELRKVDPECAQRLHSNNLGRIVRALEVYRLTGETMSRHQARSKLEPSPYRLCMLGLTYRDRQLLNARINLRVGLMEEAGLLREMEELQRLGFSKTAYQAIGYKELVPYLLGEASLEDCLEQIRLQSRRYAKRQLTWFMRDERVQWLYRDELGGDEAVYAAAKEKLVKSGILC